MATIQKIANCFRTVLKKVLEAFFLFLMTRLGVQKTHAGSSNIKSLVIPLFAGIGDAVLISAALTAIISKYKHASVTILASSRTKEILEETVNCAEIRISGSIWHHCLEKHRCDMFISPSRNIYHYIVAISLRCRIFVGYNYSLKIQKGESHLDRIAALSKQLGLNDIGLPLIRLSPDTLKNTTHLISKYRIHPSIPIIAIIAGGRWRTKQLPVSLYEELIHQLNQEYRLNILIIGSAWPPADGIAERFNNVYSLCGKTTLKQALGLMAHSEMVVGPDGGLINSAMAMHIPFVALFGPVSPESIMPHEYMDNVLYIKKCRYQPCYNEEHQPICPYDEPLCMAHSVNSVMEKIGRILSKSKNSLKK